MAVAHNVYALIHGSAVQNVVVGNYYDCNIVAKHTYGPVAVAIEVTYIPVMVGDTYENGKFYRMIQGVKTEVERIPTEEEVVAAHTVAIESQDSEIDDLWVAVLEG